MTTLHGTSVCGGIAFGRLAFYSRGEKVVKRERVADTEKEVHRFHEAKEQAKAQLEALHKKALTEVGEANAMIFEIHQMMLDDGDYCDSIENIITSQQVNAEYAAATTGDNFAQMFSAMDDDYMKERAADVKDISERLVNVLQGGASAGFMTDEPVVLAADDLAPSETVQLEKDKILAFITMHGSTNSHTAILARMMNIPAIIGIGEDLQEAYGGKTVIVDGFHGAVYIEPDQETTNRLTARFEEEQEKKRLLEELKGKENITLDGQEIELFANIGSVSDIVSVLQNDAGGVGLFRSEFLYLESDTFPSENDQFQAYRQALENMAGRKVVIRTLDIGADKQIDYFNLPKEENPAMGYRAIRICLEQPDIFKTQLRALFRASVYGKLAIMFPMITALEEIHDVKNIISEVKNELQQEGISYSDSVEIGIMIETPAAVMISDLLAKEVDFFSIGTNDLTQYTLALDRQNPKLERFYLPHHRGLLRMIKMVADNAHANGIWVGICGELGADLALTETFLALGIDELSVSPPNILSIREKVRNCNIAQVKQSLIDAIVS